MTARRAEAPAKVLESFTAPSGQRVTLYANGFAMVESPKTHAHALQYVGGLTGSSRAPIVPTHAALLSALDAPFKHQLYVPGTIVAILRSGTRLSSDDVRPPASRLAAMHRAIVTIKTVRHLMQAAPGTQVFPYSNDARLNRALTMLRVTRAKRVFTGVTASRLAAMRARASSALPVENTYVFTVTNASVRSALAALRQVASVQYAAPDFRVSPMNVPMLPIPRKRLDSARARSLAPDASRPTGLPANFDVTYSGQSMLNAPAVDALAAYDEITSRFHQLPGTGEYITNVSIGDLDDPSAASNPSDPCNPFLTVTGDPTTTEVIDGQRYLNLPSMPLIPTFTADTDGNTNPLGEVCGTDPSDGEIDLDFSVMAPLPHNQQRAAALGSGLSDLLGIAPGAHYRLVVPASFNPGAVDIAGALLGAALQQPAPNVITASLGWGFDQYGFPSRYLEEDPLVRTVVASIVAQGIVVCIASGDGLRTYTNAAVNPSGGTVPIDLGKPLDDLGDEQLSTTPSVVDDTGSIAVGGSTLDDVTAAPPYDARFAKYADQQAFPEVRWDGFGDFASAFGPRLDISAPSDNVLTVSQSGAVGLSGGTSASSPEVAAAAAVALQVARLTGKPFTGAKAVRAFLIAHANPLPNVPQADRALRVGPQVDLAQTVEALLERDGTHLKPHVDRVAIAQRYPVEASDFGFLTDTDPTTIDLTGAEDDTYGEVGYTMYQPITIAPDWEGLPKGAKFRLYVTGKPAKVLSTDRYARLYPGPLLSAAGRPRYSPSARIVNLTYEAIVGLHAVASTSIALRFLPNARELHGMGPAPDVAPVTTGTTMTVNYDISDVDLHAELDPTLSISYPGRTSTAQPNYRPLYQVKLTQPKGTIQVPISALQGDGIYGVAVTFLNYLTGGEETDSTTWAYTRVANAGSSRPPAPLVSSPYEGPGYYVDVPYESSFNVAWDVSNVKGATGAILEIAATGPTLYSNFQTFNNPNGSEVDNNAVDSGSQYTLRVSGTKGTTTIEQSKLPAAQFQSVRVIPTNGTTVVGEAGDESTIATHGIETADGGNLAGGFSINPSGTDAILTSNQLIPLSPGSNYTFTSSVEAFDQTTNTIGSFLADNSKLLDYNDALYSSFPNYFNVWGLGIDPTSDAAYFEVPPGYSQNCSPNCNSSLGAIAGIDLQWFPSVNAFADGQQSVGQPGAARPLPMPTPVNELYTAANDGYLLATDPYAPESAVAKPSLTQLGASSNIYSQPPLETTYNLTNLDQIDTLGFSAAGGYAATLATNGGNIVDVTNTATGTTQALTLGSDLYAYPSGVVMDAASQQVMVLTDPYSTFQSYLTSYSATTGAPTSAGLALSGTFPIGMVNLGNGWVAVISQWSANARNNANAIANLDIANAASGIDYAMPASSYAELGDFTELYANGLPLFSNLVQANPSQQMVYIAGPLGTEIQPIPISSLGIDLRGASRR